MRCFADTKDAIVISDVVRSLALGTTSSPGLNLSVVPSIWMPKNFSSCLSVRRSFEVHILIRQPGFRTKQIIVVTTLLDPKRFSRSKIAELYQLRWQAEVNLKHVKTTLGMERVLALTPEMVRKEIWMHLMAYNLLRTLMWQAAHKAGVAPLRVSLQGARQQFINSLPDLATATPRKLKRLYQTLLAVITHKLVPHRPNRIEPRVKKQRPKSYPRMSQPRSVLKAKLTA